MTLLYLQPQSPQGRPQNQEEADEEAFAAFIAECSFRQDKSVRTRPDSSGAFYLIEVCADGYSMKLSRSNGVEREPMVNDYVGCCMTHATFDLLRIAFQNKCALQSTAPNPNSKWARNVSQTQT